MNYTNEHLQLMSTLLRAIARYTYKRILSKEGKLAYKTAIDMCLSSIDQGWSSLEILKKKIKSTRDEVDLLYKKKFLDSFSEKRKFFLLACSHAEDVVSSIERRFITGGESYTFNIALTNKKNPIVYEEDNIF